MKTNLIFLLGIFLLIGCNEKKSEKAKIESLELKLTAQQRQLDSILKRTDGNLSNDTMQINITNLPKKTPKKYDYIKKYKNQYPSDIKLFSKDPLKSRMLKLLGQKNYELFMDYFVVQVPIEIVNDEYTFLSAGAAHMFGTYEAGIFIDFVKDEISFGILDENRFLFFTENKNKTDNSVRNSDFYTWIYEKKTQAKENFDYQEEPN